MLNVILQLDFGEVRFMESSRLTLEITNTGQVPADFSFIPKLHETTYSKDWLSIRPYRDCILPGEDYQYLLTLNMLTRNRL